MENETVDTGRHRYDEVTYESTPLSIRTLQQSSVPMECYQSSSCGPSNKTTALDIDEANRGQCWVRTGQPQERWTQSPVKGPQQRRKNRAYQQQSCHSHPGSHHAKSPHVLQSLEGRVLFIVFSKSTDCHRFRKVSFIDVKLVFHGLYLPSTLLRRCSS